MPATLYQVLGSRWTQIETDGMSVVVITNGSLGVLVVAWGDEPPPPGSTDGMQIGAGGTMRIPLPGAASVYARALRPKDTMVISVLPGSIEDVGVAAMSDAVTNRLDQIVDQETAEAVAGAALATSVGGVADAAVVDPAATGSMIALLKGIASRLAPPTAVATGQASVSSASASLIVPARSGRQSVTMINNGTTDVAIGAAGVSAATGAILSGVKGHDLVIYGGAAVYGISSLGTVVVSYVEAY